MALNRIGPMGLTLLYSNDVEEADITELADVVSEAPFLYVAEEDELRALEFIGRNYEVINELLDGYRYDSYGDFTGHILIDPFQVGIALAAEGLDRVPMLSDDTALQRIIWAIGPYE